MHSPKEVLLVWSFTTWWNYLAAFVFGRVEHQRFPPTRFLRLSVWVSLSFILLGLLEENIQNAFIWFPLFWRTHGILVEDVRSVRARSSALVWVRFRSSIGTRKNRCSIEP